jgi:hypothetical protein
LYPEVWNIENCETKNGLFSRTPWLQHHASQQWVPTLEQYTAIIFSAELRRSKDAIWIYRHLAEKVVCQIYDRSGREYLSLCGPMEMGKWHFSELL